MARDDVRADEVSQYADTHQSNPSRALRYYPQAEPGNWCNEDGAHALKSLIAARWKGYAINFAVIPGPFTMTMRCSRYDLRSDMINGMPRELFNLRKRRAQVAK